MLSVVLFWLLQTASEDYLNRAFIVNNQETTGIMDFKKYVADKNISLDDQQAIKNWVREERYINLYIYKDNQLVYATDGYTSITDHDKSLLSIILKRGDFVTIEFSNTSAQVYMEYFYEYKYYNTVLIVCVAISLLFFIFIMLLFINKKTSYIEMIESEIKILEGGNLDYPITVKGKGKDELSSLAQSLDEMRKAFKERLKNEEKARAANSELLTAISHDLRTPLTALIGYLDIIEFKKYHTADELTKYIHNSREKAYQIKQLSDKLFEYFSVFNFDDEELELEHFDGNQLIEQLIDEQLLILQHNGFHFELVSCSTPFEIKIHLISIRRVFDNLFSNIIKYANPAKPVIIRYQVNKESLFIQIENHINTEMQSRNSTGIGMKTCKRIIEEHNGQISVTDNQNIYSVYIQLPLLNNNIERNINQD